jgi:hypothetical protein
MSDLKIFFQFVLWGWLLAARVSHAENFCSLAFSPPPKNAPVETLSSLLAPNKLKEISDISDEILQRSPKNSLFVGMGRSPTPFISSLQLRTREKAISIPFSNKALRHLNSEQKSEKVYEILEKYLANNLNSQLQNLVLIDHIVSGSSLLQAQQLVKNFLKKINSPVQVSSIAITTAKFEMLHHNSFQFYNSSVDVIYLPRSSEVLHDLLQSKYDIWAEFTQFPQEGLPTKNPNYQIFFEKMAQEL